MTVGGQVAVEVGAVSACVAACCIGTVGKWVRIVCFTERSTEPVVFLPPTGKPVFRFARFVASMARSVNC